MFFVLYFGFYFWMILYCFYGIKEVYLQRFWFCLFFCLCLFIFLLIVGVFYLFIKKYIFFFFNFFRDFSWRAIYNDFWDSDSELCWDYYSDPSLFQDFIDLWWIFYMYPEEEWLLEWSLPQPMDAGEWFFQTPKNITIELGWEGSEIRYSLDDYPEELHPSGELRIDYLEKILDWGYADSVAVRDEIWIRKHSWLLGWYDSCVEKGFI